MKPNFALSLSYEGIRLYHRSPAGWDVVGEVALDAPDLSAALTDLRRRGAARDPAPMRTKIVIPNDQIRYLALDTTRATEDDVVAALDGATPYPIAALAHDLRKGGGRTHIAAVARETLDEAEAFAAEYQFAPVGFVAVPEPFTFPGEPFFGRTALADALLAGDEVERDAVPVGDAQGLSLSAVAVTRGAAEQVAPDAAAARGAAAVAPDPAGGPEAAPWERGGDAVVEGGAPAQTGDTPGNVVDLPPATGAAEPPAADSATSVPPPAGDAAAPVGSDLSVGQHPDTGSDALDAGAQAGSTPPSGASLSPVLDGAAPISGGELAGQGAETDTGPAALDTPKTGPLRDGATQAESGLAPAPAALTATDTGPLPEAGAPTDPELPLDTPPPVAGASTGQSTETPATGRESDTAKPGNASLPPEISAPSPSADAVTGQATETDDDGAAPDTTRHVDASLPPHITSATPSAAPVATDPSGGVATPTDADLSPDLSVSPEATDLSPRFGSMVSDGPDSTDLNPVPPPEVASEADLAPTPLSAGPAGPETPDSLSNPVAAGEVAAEAETPVLFASRSRSLRAPVEVPPPPVRAIGAASTGAEPVFARRAEERQVEPARKEPTLARPRPAEPAVDLPAPVVPAAGAPVPDPAVSLVPVPAVPPVVPPLRRVAPGMAPAIEPVPRGVPTDDTDADIPPLPRARAATPARTLPARKPRRLRLGLILTLALFALLALVAWWSTTIDGGLASLFGGRSATAVTAAEPAETGSAVTAEDAAVAALAAQEPAVEPQAEPPVEPVTDDLAAGAATGTLVTPDEADRIYAATGVWLRAPRLPLMPETEDLAGLSATSNDDANPAATVLAALPTGAGLAPDSGLPVQPVPADPGTVYDRDDRGLIRATPEGVLLPTGAMLFAGAPALVPPTRPGTPPPAPEQVAAAAAEAGVRPLIRPETVTTAAVAAGIIAASDDTAAVTEAALAAAIETPALNANLGGVSLNGLRPASRPEGVAPVVLPPWDGPALLARPADLAPEGATSVPEEAPPADDLEGALSAIMASAPDPVAGASAQAVPTALRPDARPNNFGRVVQNQTQILARAQQQAAAAAQAPAAAPQTGGVGTDGLSREEQAEEAPEVSNGAIEPSGAVPGGVAQAATQTDTINLRDINLLGVFGASNNRHALVRLANGRLVRVGVGDSLDGGQVVAIGDDVLNYSKRGQTISLQVPGE